MTLKQSVRGAFSVLSVLIMTACPGVLPTEPVGFKTYESGIITATWSGGRTGTPTNSTGYTPGYFPANGVFTGTYCPTSSIVLQNHVQQTRGLFIRNNCSKPVSMLVCGFAGSGSGNADLPTCNVDPRTTPLNRLLVVDLAVGEEQFVANTLLSLSLVVLYCGVGDLFTLGVVASKNPTDCFQR